ncbi:Helix-turn-helix domain-containing protein [Natronorubrum sediminis]|uniref:Helix-turn-helix domain-containing protein n=1 Tax=Natronorubrum sediminis TaxID=640943 RepID=A0A1H6G7C9_9EURY|nr:helix-turn-helix domain-containing protein [Natronorubrum sediminis]SEH17894.1 Helix-turn-helix domain-containing protein [Natronorubrum sediminis]
MSLEYSASGETPDTERVIGVLDDADCRAIIAILEEPKTASEIADEAELPLSTAYRKLDRLTDAELVSETAGVRRGRHQTARYVATFDRIAITLDDDREFRVDVEHSRAHSLGLWSTLTQVF